MNATQVIEEQVARGQTDHWGDNDGKNNDTWEHPIEGQENVDVDDRITARSGNRQAPTDVPDRPWAKTGRPQTAPGTSGSGRPGRLREAIENDAGLV